MASLSHWDYAAYFSGNDAAALILGIDPSDPANDQSRIQVVLARMELHYNHALTRCYNEACGYRIEDEPGMEANFPFELHSMKMNELRSQWNADDEDTTFRNWIVSDQQSQFDAQVFSRQVVANWLDATNLQSLYQFRLDQTRVGNELTGRWPWGNYHTVLLGHLEAAAMRYWVNYDPTDATSAPTNKVVAEWLVNERQLSQKMAESIASMLRADDLPTGPRK